METRIHDLDEHATRSLLYPLWQLVKRKLEATALQTITCSAPMSQNLRTGHYFPMQWLRIHGFGGNNKILTG